MSGPSTMAGRRGAARSRRPAWPAWAGVSLAFLLAACQGHGPASQVPPATVSATAPAGPKVVVVDFDKVVHAHPRWPDVDALNRRIADLQGRLNAVSPQLQLPQINLTPAFQAAAQREVASARPQFEQQFAQTAATLRAASQKELEAYAAQVHAEQQAAFLVQQKALTAQVQKAVDDKQQSLSQDSAQYQQQMLNEYRLPLVNLQLKQTALAGGSDRQAQQAVTQQIQAVTKERDDKINAHEQANRQALADFQTQQQAAYNQQMTALEAQFTADGQQKVAQKQAELEKAFHDRLNAKQAQLGAQMNTQIKAQLAAREQALIAGAREQMARAQAQAIAGAQAEAQSLQAQLADAESERARLMDDIIADVRVEAAALAQQQGYDVILTQAVGTVDVTDITNDLVARIKR